MPEKPSGSGKRGSWRQRVALAQRLNAVAYGAGEAHGYDPAAIGVRATLPPACPAFTFGATLLVLSYVDGYPLLHVPDRPVSAQEDGYVTSMLPALRRRLDCRQLFFTFSSSSAEMLSL